MNYTGDHPLNLIGKVAIVTSAASQTGAAICRELLNSNANVLGIDCIPAHVTTTARKGSHFQFLQYENACSPSGKQLLEYARSVYERENVDFLINFIGQDGARVDKGMMREVLDVMEAQKEGLVLNVLNSKTDQYSQRKVIDKTRTLQSQLKAKGVRCNAIVAHHIGREANQDSGLDIQTQDAMKEHIEAYHERREKGGYAVEEERDIANLVLFLCTKLGVGLSGVVLGIGGDTVAL